MLLHYEGSLGIEHNRPALPQHLDLYDSENGLSPTLRAGPGKQILYPYEHAEQPVASFPPRSSIHGDACTHIVASPLYVTELIAGFLVIGVSPRRPFDEAHRLFIEDIRRVCNGQLEQRVSYAQVRRREEKLLRKLTHRQKFSKRIAEIAAVGICTHSPDVLLTWVKSKYFESTWGFTAAGGFVQVQRPRICAGCGSRESEGRLSSLPGNESWEYVRAQT